MTVTGTGLVPATPDANVALAASNTGYQRFNPYLSADPDLRIEPFDPESGVGSGLRFDGREGKGQQTVAMVEDTAVHYAIDLGPMGPSAPSASVPPRAEASPR